MRSAAILTGGRASRFGGRDKSALVVEGRTILDRQLAMLRGVPHLGEILVVGGAPRDFSAADATRRITAWWPSVETALALRIRPSS